MRETAVSGGHSEKEIEESDTVVGVGIGGVFVDQPGTVKATDRLFFHNGYQHDQGLRIRRSTVDVSLRTKVYCSRKSCSLAVICASAFRICSRCRMTSSRPETVLTFANRSLKKASTSLSEGGSSRSGSSSIQSASLR